MSMYNEEIKKRFLQECKAAEGKDGYFARISDAEYEIGKDIAEMNRQEVLSALCRQGYADVSTVSSRITLFRAYVKWCRDNKVFPDVLDGFFEVSPEDIDISSEIVKTFFRNEQDLMDSITSTVSLDDGFVCVPVFVLGWLGAPYADILTMTDDRVNLPLRRVYSPDGSTLVDGFSDLLADALTRYVNCKTAQRENGLTYIEVVKDRSTPYFLKRMGPRGSKKFGTPYTRIQVDSNIHWFSLRYEAAGNLRRHTFTNVWRSGRMHRLFELEQSGIDVLKLSNRPLVEEVMHNKKGYYNTIKLYKAYKRAFVTPSV